MTRLEFVRERCRGKAVLDVGCIDHDVVNSAGPAWIHQAIVDVAASVVGVDYLEEDVAELRRRGYNVVAGDITKPLDMATRFDVIVLGNLIEHLSGFDELFRNLSRLLSPGGRVIISTANPFYREQYFYSAFKNDILVNPEHTCWIDPVTLDQLARRFGFTTEDVFWVKEKWNLGRVILHGQGRRFDVCTGRWEYSRPPSRIEGALSSILRYMFVMFAPKDTAARVLQKHGDQGMRRLLFSRSIGALFDAWWAIYRKVIITAPINRYELYLSVLRED